MAADRLTSALVVLAAAGGRPPCGDYNGHELWTSDSPEDRSIAADRCHECPLITACGAAADENDERFGVWAGVDRTPGKGGSRRQKRSQRPTPPAVSSLPPRFSTPQDGASS